MKSVYIKSLLLPIFGVLSITDEECGYPYGWEYQNGVCSYQCTIDEEVDEFGNVLKQSVSYTPASQLTFDFIKDVCWETTIAEINSLLPSECNSLDDLVWPADSCGCPYCKCNAVSDPSYQKFESTRIGDNDAHDWPDEIQAKCYECTCAQSSDSSITDYVYQCDLSRSVTNADDWQYYSCPINTCIKTNYDESTSEYEAGLSWFADTTDQNELCETFCYCDGTGNSVCQTGFDAIMNQNINLAKFAAFKFDIQAVKCNSSTLFDQLCQ